MKRIILVFLFFTALVFVWIHKDSRVSRETEKQLETEDVKPAESTKEEIVIGKYKIIIRNVSNYGVIILPNFKEKSTSDLINEKYNCEILTNGGLYEESGNPLGLYYLDGVYFGKLKNSSIYNGMLELDKNSNFLIDSVNDLGKVEDYKFLMQSGPLLIDGGINKNTTLLHSHARRIIFAKGLSGEDYIVVLYGLNNYNDGPDFQEVNDILVSLEQKNGIVLESALNLDGGNASVFIDRDFSIKESSMVGSFICFTYDNGKSTN